MDHWSRARWANSWIYDEGQVMRDETIVKIVAIVALTIICTTALIHGIDSVLIASISAIIGGIAGYELRALRESMSTKKKS